GALDANRASELASLVDQLALPRITAQPSLLPSAVAVLHVFVAAHVEDIETDEERTGASVLQSFDGTREERGQRLVDMASIRHATGGSCELVGVREDYGWAVASDVTLVLTESDNHLRCRLTFDVSRVPNDGELLQLLHVIEDELFFTSWGLNMVWDRHGH